MNNDGLGLFNGNDKPDVETVWNFYERGRAFNTQINLEETVKTNENFYIGKQWEGVQANGLPTPQFNIIKRVVGFIVASITTDNIKVNASALANSPGTDEFIEPVRVLNEELDALNEHNDVPALMREFARNAAVDGDGCIYSYWDPDVDFGNDIMGTVKSEIIDNTRVFFGNPNDRSVQNQPYIQIASREIVRNAKLRARENGSEDWRNIKPDSDDSLAVDSVKYTDDKVTVIMTMWRDDESGEIWCYESTKDAVITKPKTMGIRLYPICWLNWDYIKDNYHGQAMITGLIPNQIFINKAWAMSMLSIMRTAWPKVLYNQSLVRKWDNRVGGAIPFRGGDPNQVAKILDPATISPQISQFIQLAVEQTEQSLGATAVALGDTRPDNTSAIIALQRAAATPSEMTKQNLYRAIEDLFRIYVEFISNFYGTRPVDMPPPPEVVEAYQFTGQEAPNEITVEFNFDILRDNPMLLKIDIGASSYYSEIASMQTLDQLLQTNHITAIQYLERIPDGYIPRRRALINEKKQEQAQMQMQQAMLDPMAPTPAPAGGGNGPIAAQLAEDPEITGGRGYGAIQHQINAEAGI